MNKITIYHVRFKEFNGVFKVEILESPPTVILVEYIDEEGNRVRPERLARIVAKGKLPYIFRNKK